LYESAQNIDKTEKLEAYKSIGGFKEYYLIEHGKPLVTQHKIISKTHWETQEFYELSSQIEISCLEIRISLQEIYNGVIKQT
ncbi:MAG: Uma2 family endonuclease, partial [Leptospiraceae bacterium]|nr:Uma2 family endonuclease [Leptospiraceae bacterium]